MQKGRGIEWGQRALVVDDDPSVRRALSRELTRRGMGVTAVSSAEEALASLETEQPPLVVADFRMPGTDGLELLATIRERYPRTQRILVSGELDVEHMMRATNEAQVAQVVLKPIDGAVLLSAVRTALERRKLIDEHARATREVERLDGLLAELHADVKAAVAARERLVVDGKALLERMIDAIAAPLAVVDANGSVQALNKAWANEADSVPAAVIGERCYSSLMGRSTACAGCPVAAPHEEHPGIIELEIPARQAGRAWGAVLHQLSLEGLQTKAAARAKGEVCDSGWVCAYRDVTGERNTQALAQQTDRMVAVGELAAGVAHELNNPLGGILALSQVALRDSILDEDDRELMEDIEEAAKRCKRIIESLLVFARGPQSTLTDEVDVGACLQQALDLTQGPIKAAQATVELVVEPEAPRVRGSVGLLQQAFVSLLRNAAEALLPRADKGEPGGIIARVLEQGDELWVEIADNGPGLPEDRLPHLFTPFVTSRDGVEGAGFGLALVYRVAERLGGHCELASGPEGGTTARLVLPRLVSADEAGAASGRGDA